MPPLKQSRNVAARMGRWSAHHRKIAIFGWLAFVGRVVRDQHRSSPMKQIVFETSGPGESGRARQDPLRRLQAAGGESVLIQSARSTASDSRVPGGGDRT